MAEAITSQNGIRVLVAGIGGASLGTEIMKCLALAGGYCIIGCDVSPLAFGHYCGLCDRSFVVERDRYVQRVLDLCREQRIAVLIPGGNEPARLIAGAAAAFEEAGISIAANQTALVEMLADKSRCFAELERLGIAVPATVLLSDPECDDRAPIPCVVKPSIDSGGSAFVFYAGDRRSVRVFAGYLRQNGLCPVAQQYVPHEGGEFTVGVLSGTDGNILGSIAMRREFPAKLSIAAKGSNFLISSGYSQGYIAAEESICRTAETIALAVGSRGPLNIQGRVGADGRFLPFEINPRFSASTYLRAMAGFNEVDFYTRHILKLPPRGPLVVRPGWYLRGLTETVVAPDGLVS